MYALARITQRAGREGEEQNRFSDNGYFYTLSPLTGGGFTSAVAFATVEVKRPGDKGMLPIACSSGRFTSAVAKATVEVK